MTDLAKILGNVQEQRTKMEKSLDSLYVEVEALVPDIISCSSADDLWQYRDRLEDIKSTIYRYKKSTIRNLAQAKEAYRDSMRSTMTRTKNTNGLHFNEREAEYEIKNISQYKIQVNIERTLTDVDEFLSYLIGRLVWVKDRQRWLLQQEINRRN